MLWSRSCTLVLLEHEPAYLGRQLCDGIGHRFRTLAFVASIKLFQYGSLDLILFVGAQLTHNFTSSLPPTFYYGRWRGAIYSHLTPSMAGPEEREAS